MKITYPKLAAACVGLLVAATLTACAGGQSDDGEAGSLKSVTVYIAWTDMTEAHTPLALALENGYFEDEGLDVSFAYASSSANVVNLVATGGTNRFIGWGDTAVAAASINEGRSIQVVGTMFRKTPIGIVSSEEAGIRSLEDLAGKKVAAATGALPALLAPAALEKAGVEAGDVEIVTMTGAAMMSSFLSGQVDGIASFNYLNVPPVAAEGLTPTQFSFGEFDLNTYNMGFMATDELLESDPEVVRGFLEAAIRGWEDAVADPEAAITAGEAVGSSINADNFDTQLATLQGSLELLYWPGQEDQPLGCMDIEGWEATQEILVQYTGMSDPIGADKYFTNDYLPNC